MKKNIIITAVFIFLFPYIILSQNFGNFSGNAQIEAQSYKQDSLMGANKVAEQVLSNGYFNLNYANGNLTAGVRYEYYLNPVQGISSKYAGQGIAYRYVDYSSEIIDVTLGNFYEQFGSGMIFRAYEEKSLGWDNSMDGARFRVRPLSGIDITGLIGKQRQYWTQGDGIVRGGDLNVGFNELFGQEFAGTNITAGASCISVYQADKSSKYNYPENVMAYSARVAAVGDNFSIDGEYSYKYNAPNAVNKNSFNPGYGIILNGSYFNEGFSATLNLHKIDNMDFRSDRTALNQDLMLSFIPPLTKQHTYTLAAMYPYATQFNGEAGLQAEAAYKIPKNTFLGGKYGTDITLNFSRVQSIDTTKTDDYHYDSPFFGIGDVLYFQDLNLSIGHKVNKDFSFVLSYFNQIYDRDILEHSGVPYAGKVISNTIAFEATERFTDAYSLKCVAQHQWSKQDSTAEEDDLSNGNWLELLAEFSISPGWFFSVWDDWNYGNTNEDRRIHYINAQVAYSKGSSRISFGYGRQRSGILCVGGICRQVPAANGFFLLLNHSF